MALRTLGEPIGDYDGLIALVRLRLAELGTTCEAASALGGLTDTHISKIVCPARVRVLGRMSFSVILQVLGIKLTATVDDEAYARLRARLPKATFHRWKSRELRVRVDDVGGVAAVEKVPALRVAVTVPIAEKPKKPPEPPKHPAFDVNERHPLPERRRPMMFARGQRKTRPSAGAAA